MRAAEPPDTAPPEPPKRRSSWVPSFGQVAAIVSLLGIASLCFIAGAAMMHANGPAAKPLAEAFQGAKVWLAGTKGTLIPGGRNPLHLSIDKPGLAFDGFTLCTSTEGDEAHLCNMSGESVYRWTMPADIAWAAEDGLPARSAQAPVHWERCYLYPNGDLLALCCPGADQPYGFGVVKIDKNSRLLWNRAGRFHHNLEVGEDGRIYLLAQARPGTPPPNLEGLPAFILDEDVVILSPAGEVEQRISLLKAFTGTPYLETLLSGNVIVGDSRPDLASRRGLRASRLRWGFLEVGSLRAGSLRAVLPPLAWRPGTSCTPTA